MSEAEKHKSHMRILDAAARLMREKGIESTSVSDVMKAAGLTHGGFYRHFASKEALAVAAFRQAVDEVVSDLERASSNVEQVEARDSYVARYLSLQHVMDRGQGCPLAAMGPEISHLEGSLKGETSATIDRMTGLLGSGEDRAVSQGFAIMALLLGTVTLARLVEKQEDAAGLLDAGMVGVDLLQRFWSK